MDEEKDVEQRDPESDERDVTIESESEIKRSDLFTEDSEDEKAESKVAKMREELGVCRKEKQEYMDGWQRAKADYVNLLKRIEGDAKASELRGKIKAVETLLPAFDALERAKEYSNLEVQLPSDGGFMAITKQIESAFASLGLEEIGKVGEKFDPALHEAFGQDKVDSIEEDDIITTILDKGWRVGEVTIRPAKVRVGHYS